MNQTHDENRGIHGKSINYYTGTGHCPSTGHPYIKATYHEWNNSKEERFPLWLPRTTLCVWMYCSSGGSRDRAEGAKTHLFFQSMCKKKKKPWVIKIIHSFPIKYMINSLTENLAPMAYCRWDYLSYSPIHYLHTEALGRANPNTLSLDHSLHGYAHSLVSKRKLFVAEMGTVGLKANQSQHIPQAY